MQKSSTRRKSLRVAGRVEEKSKRAREILYIDEQCLTRECISHALAAHLPDLSVEPHAMAQNLQSDNSLAPDRFALIVLHGHGGRIDLRTHTPRIADSRIVNELSLLERIAPDIPLVLLSDVETAQNVIEAFRRRIRGYVPTTLPIQQVAEAIRFAWAGGTYVPPTILLQSVPLDVKNGPLAAPPAVPGNFSPRQREVLRRLWSGKPNKTIAYELSMCESTVKVHIRQIMKKVHATNRTQVVVLTRPSSFDGTEPRSSINCASNVPV